MHLKKKNVMIINCTNFFIKLIKKSIHYEFHTVMLLMIVKFICVLVKSEVRGIAWKFCALNAGI